MMLDPTPAKAKSRHPLWGLWTKSLVVGCLLSSAAMLTQPSPAHARNGVNGFMAGAILGGAFRGFGPPTARGYRTGRTVRTTTRSRSGRGSRSKEKPEKEEILRTEPAGTTAAAGGAAATAATTTTAASANAGSGPSAGASTAAATEGRGNGSRSSRRNGRRGGGGLETVNGLE